MVTHSRDKKLNQKNTEHFNNNAARDERLWGENGLHLKKKAKGCAFVVRFRSPTGKRKDITLGKYGVMSLEQAKNKALLIASEGIDRKDPLEERRKRKLELARLESSTVGSFYYGYYTDFQESKKDGQGSLLRIKKHFNHWFNKPMSEITPNDVDIWFRSAKKQGARFSTIKRKSQPNYYRIGNGTMNKHNIKSIDLLDEVMSMTKAEQLVIATIKDVYEWDNQNNEAYTPVSRILTKSNCVVFRKGYKLLKEKNLVRRTKQSHYMINPSAFIPLDYQKAQKLWDESENT